MEVTLAHARDLKPSKGVIVVLELLFVERRGNERKKGEVLREQNLNISRRCVGACSILCRKVEVIYQGNDRKVTSAWIAGAVSS